MKLVLSIINQENQKGQLLLALLIEALIVALVVSVQLIH
jgi:hypothetical protein